jgi:hypothetical protein
MEPTIYIYTHIYIDRVIDIDIDLDIANKYRELVTTLAKLMVLVYSKDVEECSRGCLSMGKNCGIRP